MENEKLQSGHFLIKTAVLAAGRVGVKEARLAPREPASILTDTPIYPAQPSVCTRNRSRPSATDPVDPDTTVLLVAGSKRCFRFRQPFPVFTASPRGIPSRTTVGWRSIAPVQSTRKCPRPYRSCLTPSTAACIPLHLSSRVLSIFRLKLRVQEQASPLQSTNSSEGHVEEVRRQHVAPPSPSPSPTPSAEPEPGLRHPVPLLKAAMKLPTRAALAAWLCIVSSQRQADAAFQCVRRGDGSWTGLGTSSWSTALAPNHPNNTIQEIDANQLNLAAGTDFESGHVWLYSRRCGNEAGVLNRKAGTYFGCGNGVFVIHCSSGSSRRINQYLALDGCNNRTSAGWFVGAGNSGSCQCNTNYTCIKCQCNRVSSCTGHGVPRTSTFTDSASCNCDTNYTGANCQHNRTSACNNRGIPTEDGGSCLGGCDTGYRGASCEYDRARTCNGNGDPTSDDGSCMDGCDPGFHGARCQFSDFIDCNEAGFVDSAGVCTCIANVHGANCEHNRTNSCNGNGDPTSHDGTCLTGCDATFAGPHCEYSRVANCNNRGDPNDDGSCTGNCAGGYAGALCQHSRQDQCGGHGIPNDDGSCTGNCDVGYAGRACEHSRVTDEPPTNPPTTPPLEVTSGRENCLVTADNCVTDGGGDYGANESCTILVSTAGTLSAVGVFQTEATDEADSLHTKDRKSVV